MERRDQTHHRVVEQDRTDAGVGQVGLALVEMGRAEERLVLLHRLALVVEDRPAGAEPTRRRVPFDDVACRVTHERTRSDVQPRWRQLAARRVSRLGLDLLLNLAPEAVAVGEPDLDLRLLTRSEVLHVRHARQCCRKRRLARAPEAVEVVDDSRRRLPEQRGRIRLRVGDEAPHIAERRIRVDVLGQIAEGLARLAHDRSRDDQAERIEDGGDAVAVRIRHDPWLKHAIVVLGSHRVAGCVLRACDEQVTRPIARLRLVPKRIAEQASPEEVRARLRELHARGRRGLAVEDGPARDPPRTIELDVAADVGPRPFEDRRRIREQVLVGLPRPLSLEDIRHEARRQREPIGLSGQRERLEIEERQEPRQVVAPIENACARKQPLARRRCVVQQGKAPCSPFLERKSRSIVRRTEPGQFERLRLCRKRHAVRVWIVDRRRESVLGVGDQRRRLPVAVPLRRQLRIGAAVTDHERPEDVAEWVDVERQRVPNARIAGIAFVVVRQRLARVCEEDRVPIRRLRLKQLDGEVLLDDLVWVRLFIGAVERVDLLAQHRPLQRTTRLALLVRGQPRRQGRVWE